MALEDIATSMRARMPWTVGRMLLEENAVPRGRGWDNTVEKLSNDVDVMPEAEQALSESLRQHLLCGEKLMKLYPLNRARREALTAELLAAAIEDTPAARAYPLLLPEEEVATAPMGMTLIAVEEDERGLFAVFSSIRLTTVREEIEEDTLTEETREALSQYQEIIGVKNVRAQAIDVVYVPRDRSHIELRIDFPQGALYEQGNAASNMVLERINGIAVHAITTDPVNMFPLIEHMYHSPSEGKVVELAFGTTTRSLKHEKMRRGAMDLRQEVYHRGGKAALATAIEPHKISIEYERRIDENLISRPELSLIGTTRSAARPNPILSSAVIRKCSSLDDFDHVRRRIRHFIRQNAPDPA